MSAPDKMTLTVRVTPDTHARVKEKLRDLNTQVPGFTTDFNKLSNLWIERWLAGDPALQLRTENDQ